jgi:hypothetical protein
VTLAIEAFLIVLLLLAMGYGFMLNRRIVALRKDQKDLEKLAASFTKATQRAESGVAQLRTATQGSVTALQEAMQKAEGIRRDLEFLIDRGQGTADKLERGVRSAERGTRVATNEDQPRGTHVAPQLASKIASLGASKAASLGKRPDVDPAEQADAERALIRALRAAR